MVTVRSAEVTDVPDIREIAREAWHAAYGSFVAESTIEGRLGEWYAAEAVERGVQATEVVYLVAEDAEAADSPVVGYASASDSSRDDPETAILHSIYVTPARWGDGVGTALLEDVMARLRERGAGRLRATVLADNDVGRSFYDRRGFDRVAEREEELGEDRYDALLVERPL